MMSAAESSSFFVLRMRPAGFAGDIAGIAFHERHHGDAGLEPGQAERQFGKHEQRNGEHRERVTVLRRRARSSSAARIRDARRFPEVPTQ